MEEEEEEEGRNLTFNSGFISNQPFFPWHDDVLGNPMGFQQSTQTLIQPVDGTTRKTKRDDGFIYQADNSSDDDLTYVPQQRQKSVAKQRGRPVLASEQRKKRAKLPTVREEISNLREIVTIKINNESQERDHIADNLQRLANMSVQLDPASYIQHLNQTIINQQIIIQNMQIDSFNAHTRYKQEECDLLSKYREEIEHLQETNRKLRENCLYKKKEEEEEEEEGFFSEKERGKSRTHMKNTLLSIKLEKNTIPPPINIYDWSELKKHDQKCYEIYGFTVTQIEQLVDILEQPDYRKSNSGRKSTTTKELNLLIILNFMRFYRTLLVMHDNFKLGKTTLLTILNSFIENAPIFFRSSYNVSGEKNGEVVLATHFIKICKPQDQVQSLIYYRKEDGLYGIYAHYVINKQSKRAISVFLSPERNPPVTWSQTYRISYDDNLVSEYMERMLNKFAITHSQFRGAISDLPNIMSLLLTLTNYDIQFKNIVVPRETCNLT
jgi:hypothetical protein